MPQGSHEKDVASYLPDLATGINTHERKFAKAIFWSSINIA
jgi:hypothetical protein